MEHIKKTILVSTPFTMSPTEWYGKFIELVKAYHAKYGDEIKEYIEKIPKDELTK